MLPSQTANGSNPQESLPSSSASAKPVPVSTIAGGAAAGVVLIIGIAVLAFWIGRTRRRRRQLGDITHDEATLFKEQANSDQPYADDDAPAYLTHQRPGTGPQKTKSTPSSSAYTHSDTFTAYDAPQSITPYATSLQAHAVVVPPTHMPAHIPMAAAHPLPPPAPPVSDYGIASVTGTTVSSSRSDGSSAGIRYRTAQEEKALVYLSESGISRGGQSLSGERVTGTSGPAGSSSNLPATGEAPPPAYIP
ncbi:hypothetical protein C8Q80DRAFT_1149064 [Daedaleopsis nitida]|nr:hypothetical protein C8Q80DRAFT_1149064 [Daedaleopsis nitida]